MSTRVRYNVRLMAEDVAAKGWTKVEFARVAGVANMTVIRFLRGEFQNPPTAAKLAEALGQSLERYVVRETTHSSVA